MLGQGHRIWQRAPEMNAVIIDLRCVRPEPREQGSPRGSARRLLAIVAQEGQARLGQTVDVGRFRFRAAETAQLCPEVRDQDQQYVPALAEPGSLLGQCSSSAGGGGQARTAL